MAGARLVPVVAPADPDGTVVVLHGGGSRRGSMEVSPTQLSVLRMVPIAQRIARTGRGRLAVHRLLNTHRGWDTHHTPVQDVVWALGELRRDRPLAPVCLVGHSLGGRAALLAGGSPDVVSVCALNPWVYPDDDVDLSGRRVLVVHGDRDRIARPARSAAVADRLRRRAEVGYVVVRGGKHAMLRRAETYEGLAAAFVAATLLGAEPAPTLRAAFAEPAPVEV